MKNTLVKTVSSFIFGAMLFCSFVGMPFAAHAQLDPNCVTSAAHPLGELDPLCIAGKNTNNNNNSTTVTTPLQNPIRVDTIPEFVEAALEIVLIVGVPIVAFFLILSGFMFVVARGNAEKLETAKRTLLYTIIGAALLLGAWVIAQLIQSTVDALRTP